ncbi:MAG TPA: hypothetical protein VIW69_18335 [Candidatus Elarobacter sp.]
MTIRARASALALLAAVACAGALVAAGQPVEAEPPARDACAEALRYERTASSNAVTRQAAYDSAVAGLTVNQSCANPQQHLVFDAYLLSMRAAAAHDLNVGDWRRDLARANDLLAQCTTTPGLARTKTADDCRTQLQYNRSFEAAAVASPPPSPPASPRPASPSPRPPG